MSWSTLAVFAFLLALFVPGCGAPGGTRLPDIAVADSITLTSPAFVPGGAIPARFTCDGEDVSPALQWSGGPPSEEYALLLTDPDAPGGTFTHWVVYGIPGTITELPEGRLPEGVRQGMNDFHSLGYRGPCPPAGSRPHRYVFTIYSLRTATAASIPPGASPQDVLDTIRCCLQARGTVLGTYGR
jgi:Raf kinase inhibitor-like YbhB/YbcL family protein